MEVILSFNLPKIIDQDQLFYFHLIWFTIFNLMKLCFKVVMTL